MGHKTEVQHNDGPPQKRPNTSTFVNHVVAPHRHITTQMLIGIQVVQFTNTNEHNAFVTADEQHTSTTNETAAVSGKCFVFQFITKQTSKELMLCFQAQQKDKPVRIDTCLCFVRIHSS